MAASIKVGEELQKTIRALELQAPGAAARALDESLIPIVVAAKAAWPRKTGFSANALRIRVELENGRIVKYVENNVGYSGGIEFKGGNGNVAETLVFDPIERALGPILEAFARELARA